MGAILDDGEDPNKAAKKWLSANPDVVMGWVNGVTTLDGKDGAAAVKFISASKPDTMLCRGADPLDTGFTV